MEKVYQEKLGQCGPACVATVLGISLGEALKLFGPTDNGAQQEDITNALHAAGMPAHETTDVCSGDLAILTVPSLNHVGLLHLIVHDFASGEIHDPSRGPRRYPEDGYIKDGSLLPPQWSIAIVVGRTIESEGT